MNRPSSQYEYMSLDDFEELLADKPADEKWELISGRVVRMMVGARQEHNRICQNIATAMMTDFRRKGSDCRYARVERDQLAVDIFDRVEGGFFERPRLAAAVDVLRLPAVGFELSLAQIYRDVISG